MYYFFSLSSKTTRKNIGICIVQAPNQQEARSKIDQLKLRPNAADDIECFELNEEQFKLQEIELNQFYSKEQAQNREFQRYQR